MLFLAVVMVLLVPTLASPVHQAHAASSPDLTVDNIWLEENSSVGQPVTQVNPGDQFLIFASIKNLGTATASGYYLDVYYDSDYGRGGPDTIAPGETQIWYIGPLTAQAGTHTTKWILDPDDQIVELNESNNEKDYTFTIGSQTTNTTTTTTSMTTSSSTTTPTTGTTTASTESQSSSTFSQTVVPKAITSNGGVSIDTSQSKFGGASGLFDGSDDYLSIPDSADWYFGTGDFTIDCWVRFNTVPTSGVSLYQQWQDSNNRFQLRIYDASGVATLEIRYNIGGVSWTEDYSGALGWPAAFLKNTWYHVAFVHSGNSWYVAVNGNFASTRTHTDSVTDLSGSVYIGYDTANNVYLDGWIDEYRVSKGIARWTSNFTPPTAPYSRDSQTVLLLHMDGNNGSTTFPDDVNVVTTTTTTSTTTTTATTSNSTTISTTQVTTTTSSTTSSTSSSTSSNPVSVSIILNASPSGSIVVDGTTYTSPQTFAWIPGSSHTVSANSPVSGASGTQYVWASWSDGGAQSHTITTPSSLTTYTANYQTRFQVTYSQTGCTLPVSLPATEWVNATGSAVGSFPTTVSSGDGKTQCTLQSSAPAGPINAATARAATYKTQYYLTVASSYGNPAGQGWYDAGSTATFTVTSPASGGAGTQYAFTGWVSSDTGGYAGADASHSLTVSSPITETASWKTQWQVAFAVNPSGDGSIAVNGQPSATAWYDDGAVINVQASHSTGYAFSFWSGDVASITFANSTSSSTTVTIHGTGTVTARFALADTTPPVITSTVTPNANSNGWNNGPVTVTWSVSDPESGIASSNGCNKTTLTTETGQQGTTLTCSVTNGAGLSSSASVTVRIDLTAPTLNLPQSIVVEPSSSSGTAVSYNASASDPLSGLDKLSCTPPSGSTFSTGNNIVSCSASDKAGNTATGTFAVTVQDKTPPVIAVPADITIDAAGPGGAAVTFNVSALDAVDGAIVSTCSPASGSTFAVGSTVVSCSATDKAGNTGSASFKVTVSDRSPPTLNLPSAMTVNSTSPNGEVVTYSASASDLVDGSVPVTCIPASGSTFPLGTTTVSCSATDKAGNTATGTFTVTLQDKAPPVVTVPADMTVDATSKDGAVVTFAVSASDLVDGSVPVTCTPASGSTFSVGTTKVTCSATDKAGNAATGTFAVTVQDKTPPVVTVPADMTVNDTDPSGAVVTFTVSASDAVDGAITPSCSPASGSTFAVGSTKVTCSATDKAGNTGSASFNVLVQDKTPPVVTVPSDMTVGAAVPGGAVVTFNATALDNVDGVINPTCSPASGSTFAMGSTVVSCSATDKSGNTGSASFKVTVLDKTPPTLNLPSAMTVEGTSSNGAVVTYSASASDLVDGSVPVTCTPASGSTFPFGTTTVSCSATDKAGTVPLVISW